MSVDERRVVTGVTVDTPDPEERDDAFDLTLHPDGSATLLISIVDVAAIVPIGSEEDRRAHRLCFSRYFGDDTAEQMFSPRLVDNELSLRTGTKRPTLTLEINLTSKGVVRDWSVFRSWLTIRDMLEFDDVNAILADTSHSDYEWWQSCLQIARLLGTHTDSRDSDQEGVIEFDAEWMSREGRDYGGWIVFQFMILANRLLTEYALTHEIPILFRNHHPGYYAPIEDMNERNWWEYDINHNAHYGPQNLGHVALGLVAYGHWTSPIRRIPDRVAWLQLIAHMDGSVYPYGLSDLATIADDTNREVALWLSGLRVRPGRSAHHVIDPDSSGIESLSEGEFSEYIKLLTMRRLWVDPESSDAIIERIVRGNCTGSDLARILSWGHLQSVRVRRVKNAVLQTLAGNLSRVEAFYDEGVDTNGWPAATTLRWESEGRDLYFVTEHFDITLRSARQEVGIRQNQRVRQRALLSLIAQLSGYELFETGFHKYGTTGALINRCQWRGLPPPELYLAPCGTLADGRESRYTCFGIVYLPNETLCVTTDASLMMSPARERAATKLLQLLNRSRVI